MTKWFESIPTLTRSANQVWGALDKYQSQEAAYKDAKKKAAEQAALARQQAVGDWLKESAIASGRMLKSGKYPEDTSLELQREVRGIATQRATDEFRIGFDTEPNEAEVIIQEYINKYYAEQADKAGDTEAAGYYSQFANWIAENKQLPPMPETGPAPGVPKTEAGATGMGGPEKAVRTVLSGALSPWWKPAKETIAGPQEIPPDPLAIGLQKAWGKVVDIDEVWQLHQYARELKTMEETHPEQMDDADKEFLRIWRKEGGEPTTLTPKQFEEKWQDRLKPNWPWGNMVWQPTKELKEAYYNSTTLREQIGHISGTPLSLAAAATMGITAIGARAGLAGRLGKMAPVVTRGAKVEVLGIKVLRGALLPVEVAERAIALPFQGAAKLVQGRRIAAKWNTLDKVMRNEIEPILKKVDDGVPLTEADYAKLTAFDDTYSKALKDMAARTEAKVKPVEVAPKPVVEEVKPPVAEAPVAPVATKAVPEAEIGKGIVPEMKPITGEQAGMLGVPGKHVEQAKPYTVATESMDDYLKLEAMKADEQIARVDALLEKSGKLPAGMGKRADLLLEKVRLQAKKDIIDIVKTEPTAEARLKVLRTEIKDIETDLSKRTMPYGSGYVVGKKPLQQPFRGVSTAELDARRAEFVKVADELEEAISGVPTLTITPQEAAKELTQARMEFTQAGSLRMPNIIVGEKAVGKALEEAGVQITPKGIKKGLFTTLKLSPVRVTARGDPAASEIARLGRSAYQKYELSVVEGLERGEKAFKGISVPELEKLVAYQEKGVLTPEFIKQLPIKYRRAIDDGIQWFNKEIRTIAEQEFKIDTSKWSFTDYNYFHHLFLGDQMLKVGGKTKAIGKLGELYEQATELIKQGVPPIDISIGPKFSQTDIPSRLVSRKSFWGFVSDMAKKLEISGEDVLAELHGVMAIEPRAKFVGAFRKRAINLEGYSKDARKVYAILWDRVQRKRYLEPFSKQATDMLPKIKTPWLREFMKEHIKDVAGKYQEPSYFLGINLSKVSADMVKIQARLKLGYRPSTAFLNSVQPFQTALQEEGRFLIQGYFKRLTPAGRAIIDELKIAAQQAKYATGGFMERGRGQEPLWKPLGMFSRREMVNREAVGVGGYIQAIKKFKFSHQDALDFANDVIAATQYRYDVSDLPKVFRHPVGRMAFQFKPFVIQYVSNALDVLTMKPLAGLEKYEALMYPTLASKVSRAATFLGTNMAAGGLKTIHNLFTPYMSGGILAYLAIRHPSVFKGAFSYVGIDMSERAGASPWELMPDSGWDLLGLPAGDVQKITKAIKDYVDSEDPKDLLTIMKIAPEAWGVYRAFTEEEGVQPTQYERILIALGFEPTRLSDIKVGMRYIHYTQDTMRTKVGYLPTEAALQNIVYYVTENKAVTREADETERQYKDRVESARKRREVCLEILKDSGVTPERYSWYLQQRKSRLYGGKSSTGPSFYPPVPSG